MKDRRYLSEQPSGHRRPVNQYEPRQSFLIVCEGEKTEPNYFKRFPIPSDSIIDVRGLGDNTLSLVNEAVRLSKIKKYDQVWCVFDRDSFPKRNFYAALQLAREYNFFVAYSNEAFELWYLLHFRYLDTGITRKDYIKCLERELGHPYAKNSETIFNEIFAHKDDAIRNAIRLLKQYDPSKPADDNPSTTVHLLVEQLDRIFWPS